MGGWSLKVRLIQDRAAPRDEGSGSADVSPVADFASSSAISLPATAVATATKEWPQRGDQETRTVKTDNVCVWVLPGTNIPYKSGNWQGPTSVWAAQAGFR